MARLSARLLLFISFVGVPGSVIFAFDGAPLPVSLEPHELTDPKRVAAWLKENAATADKAFARQFFNSALKDKRRNAWGPAGKGFCDSALFFPMPDALSECANAQAHSLGDARAREKNFPQKSRGDMKHVELIYHSAKAADAVLNALSAAEKKQLQANISCLSAFADAGVTSPDCEPLRAYGLK